MRIAMVAEHADPLAALGGAGAGGLGGTDAGGRNTHVAELAAALAAFGHEVRVFSRRDDPSTPETMTVRGYELVHVPAGPPAPLHRDALLPHLAGFAEWIAASWHRTGPPDVVHAHFWTSGLAAITAVRDFAVPVVQTFHGIGTVHRRHHRPHGSGPPGRIAYERRLGRAVDRVIVQSRDELRELLRLGAPRSRTTLVPSGVNVTRFTPEGTAAPREDGHPRIMTVARGLIERKGVEDLIRAISRVPRADLVVAGGPRAAGLGDDPYARRLMGLAAECRVAHRVHLLGAVPADEMPEWYRSADVLAATPRYEAFGLSALESMACGVPVVATAVGGLADTVVDGVTGDLVQPHDHRAVGEALRRLLHDDMRRTAYGLASLDRVVHSYTWPRIALRIASIYDEVVQRSRLARPPAGIPS